MAWVRLATSYRHSVSSHSLHLFRLLTVSPPSPLCPLGAAAETSTSLPSYPSSTLATSADSLPFVQGAKIHPMSSPESQVLEPPRPPRSPAVWSTSLSAFDNAYGSIATGSPSTIRPSTAGPRFRVPTHPVRVHVRGYHARCRPRHLRLTINASAFVHPDPLTDIPSGRRKLSVICAGDPGAHAEPRVDVGCGEHD